MKTVEKAYAISDAKISFVSLVDKAANKKQFLIAKADAKSGSATFQSYGRILKADEDSHFVTGIVYEPMVEDSQGEYMTAEEITKAAHWFMKNDGDVDIQHCFEKANGVEVVESFVAKSDMEIEGTEIKKGTWLMTMEVTDSDIWGKIQKGEITGFSMGGTGSVSTEDVPLEPAESVEKSEQKTLFQKLAKAFGYEVVQKGEVKDKFDSRIKGEGLYQAYYALRDTLDSYHYDANLGQWVWGWTDDENVINEALTDFVEICQNILTGEGSIAKAFEKSAQEAPADQQRTVEKAGKSLSAANLKTLTDINISLSDFLAGFAEADTEKEATEKADKDDAEESDNNKSTEKEEQDMKKSEVQALVAETVAKAMEPLTKQVESLNKAEGDDVTEAAPEEAPAPEAEMTSDDVAAMVSEAVAKAMKPISQQLAVIKQSRALPSNLNDAHDDIKKESGEEHYLHGIL